MVFQIAFHTIVRKFHTVVITVDTMFQMNWKPACTAFQMNPTTVDTVL